MILGHNYLHRNKMSMAIVSVCVCLSSMFAINSVRFISLLPKSCYYDVECRIICYTVIIITDIY